MSFRPLILAFVTCTLTWAQDSQSLGDVARQARKQKQPPQANSEKSAVGQNAGPSKSSHVFTNDEIPEKPSSSNPDSPAPANPDVSKSTISKHPAEYWKVQILRVKNSIATLQKNIDGVNGSIHFIDANYENHVLWNERQREKQQQVELMKSQLTQFQKLLDDMQEAARSQGYGSSVYDP